MNEYVLAALSYSESELQQRRLEATRGLLRALDGHLHLAVHIVRLAELTLVVDFTEEHRGKLATAVYPRGNAALPVLPPTLQAYAEHRLFSRYVLAGVSLDSRLPPCDFDKIRHLSRSHKERYITDYFSVPVPESRHDELVDMVKVGKHRRIRQTDVLEYFQATPPGCRWHYPDQNTLGLEFIDPLTTPALNSPWPATISNHDDS